MHGNVQDTFETWAKNGLDTNFESEGDQILQILCTFKPSDIKYILWTSAVSRFVKIVYVCTFKKYMQNHYIVI